jgi:hypothetical protein
MPLLHNTIRNLYNYGNKDTSFDIVVQHSEPALEDRDTMIQAIIWGQINRGSSPHPTNDYVLQRICTRLWTDIGFQLFYYSSMLGCRHVTAKQVEGIVRQ